LNPIVCIYNYDNSSQKKHFQIFHIFHLRDITASRGVTFVGYTRGDDPGGRAARQTPLQIWGRAAPGPCGSGLVAPNPQVNREGTSAEPPPRKKAVRVMFIALGRSITDFFLDCGIGGYALGIMQQVLDSLDPWNGPKQSPKIHFSTNVTPNPIL